MPSMPNRTTAELARMWYAAGLEHTAREMARQRAKTIARAERLIEEYRGDALRTYLRAVSAAIVELRAGAEDLRREDRREEPRP